MVRRLRLFTPGIVGCAAGAQDVELETAGYGQNSKRDALDQADSQAQYRGLDKVVRMLPRIADAYRGRSSVWLRGCKAISGIGAVDRSRTPRLCDFAPSDTVAEIFGTSKSGSLEDQSTSGIAA